MLSPVANEYECECYMTLRQGRLPRRQRRRTACPMHRASEHRVWRAQPSPSRSRSVHTKMIRCASRLFGEVLKLLQNWGRRALRICALRCNCPSRERQHGTALQRRQRCRCRHGLCANQQNLWCRLACTSSRHAAPLVLGQVRVARGVDPWPSELTMKKMIGQVMFILHTPPHRRLSRRDAAGAIHTDGLPRATHPRTRPRIRPHTRPHASPLIRPAHAPVHTPAHMPAPAPVHACIPGCFVTPARAPVQARRQTCVHASRFRGGFSRPAPSHQPAGRVHDVGATTAAQP